MDDIQKENNATNVNILFFILIKCSSLFRNICTNEDMRKVWYPHGLRHSVDFYPDNMLDICHLNFNFFT